MRVMLFLAASSGRIGGSVNDGLVLGGCSLRTGVMNTDNPKNKNNGNSNSKSKSKKIKSLRFRVDQKGGGVEVQNSLLERALAFMETTGPLLAMHKQLKSQSVVITKTEADVMMSQAEAEQDFKDNENDNKDAKDQETLYSSTNQSRQSQQSHHLYATDTDTQSISESEKEMERGNGGSTSAIRIRNGKQKDTSLSTSGLKKSTSSSNVSISNVNDANDANVVNVSSNLTPSPSSVEGDPPHQKSNTMATVLNEDINVNFNIKVKEEREVRFTPLLKVWAVAAKWVVQTRATVLAAANMHNQSAAEARRNGAEQDNHHQKSDVRMFDDVLITSISTDDLIDLVTYLHCTHRDGASADQKSGNNLNRIRALDELLAAAGQRMFTPFNNIITTGKGMSAGSCLLLYTPFTLY